MLEVVAAGGYGPTAAPLIASDGALWFADDDAVFRVAGGAVEAVLAGRAGVGGVVEHELGVVVSGPDLTLRRSDGTLTGLFAGEEDTAFTGVTVDANGWIVAGAAQGRVVVVGPTFVAVACDVPARPWDVAFVPGRGFFVCTGDAVLRADVDRQGAIGDTLTPFASPGGAFGLAADADGGLWVATGEALVRIDAASGTVLGEVACPGARAVALRGEDALVCAGDTLLRGSLGVRGGEVPIGHV